MMKAQTSQVQQCIEAHQEAGRPVALLNSAVGALYQSPYLIKYNNRQHDIICAKDGINDIKYIVICM